MGIWYTVFKVPITRAKILEPMAVHTHFTSVTVDSAGWFVAVGDTVTVSHIMPPCSKFECDDVRRWWDVRGVVRHWVRSFWNMSCGDRWGLW
jgi:hypothetical protein